jgi:hypothetical protein
MPCPTYSVLHRGVDLNLTHMSVPSLQKKDTTSQNLTTVLTCHKMLNSKKRVRPKNKQDTETNTVLII